MLSMDRDVDFVIMYQVLKMDVNLLDVLKMPNRVPWNVDDDSQHNNDDNLLLVDDMNHQHPILVAKFKNK